MQKITTFLLFTGQAEEAMNFYVSLFEDSKIVEVKRHGPHTGGTEGSIMRATFLLSGVEFMCIDSPPVHKFNFTPSMSQFVNCQSEAEVEKLFNALSDGGSVMMPLNSYPFSKKYAWVSDKFGVSWQLSFNG